MVIVQQSSEARSAGDLAICPVVIRQTDVPDQLATDALVKTLGHVVLGDNRTFPRPFDRARSARSLFNYKANRIDNFGGNPATLARIADPRLSKFVSS
jgi:hypothetical protein